MSYAEARSHFEKGRRSIFLDGSKMLDSGSA
jgi:hypothetical protein